MGDLEPGVGPQSDAKNLNPQDAGGRADEGKNPPNPPVADPPPTPDPSIKSLESALALEKQNAAASARQEQVNRQQLQAQAAKIKELEAAPKPTTTTTSEFPTLKESAADLKKAMYDNDDQGVLDAVSNISSISAKVGREEAQEVSALEQSTQARRAQVGQYFAPYKEQLNDPKDPVTARALEIYGQLDNMHKAGNYMNWLPDDTLPIQVAPGVNHEVNIHLLKEAHQQAALEIAKGAPPTPAPDPEGGSDPTLLEGSGGGGGGPAVVTDNVLELLSEDDRTAALAYGDSEKTDEENYQEYFNNFSDPLKQARKKLGRPVSSTELISAGIMEK